MARPQPVSQAKYNELPQVRPLGMITAPAG